VYGLGCAQSSLQALAKSAQWVAIPLDGWGPVTTLRFAIRLAAVVCEEIDDYQPWPFNRPCARPRPQHTRL
jgi:hypothetical protein